MGFILFLSFSLIRQSKTRELKSAKPDVPIGCDKPRIVHRDFIETLDSGGGANPKAPPPHPKPEPMNQSCDGNPNPSRSSFDQFK
jgi:hypothetical protein